MNEVILTIFFILIAAVGLFITLRSAFIVTLSALMTFLIVIYFESQKSKNINEWEIAAFLVSIIFLSLFYYLIAKIKNAYDKYLTELKEMLQSFDIRINQINQANQDIKQHNQELSRKAGEISYIYNSIKDMSSTLDFHETLKSFTADLSELNKFKKARLLLITVNENTRESDEKTFQIESVYQLKTAGPETPLYETIEKSDFDISLVHFILQRQKEKFLESTIYFENENELNKSGISFDRQDMVLPLSIFSLLVKNEVLGIIMAEGIKKDEHQKMSIIINHFAMEVKKIRLFEKLKSLSIIDGLTGLYLRRHFIKRLEEEMERVKRNKSILSIMMFDIDDFKKFNDQYGHLAGDIILKETSSIIKSNSREIDLIGRYGGDEILMALPMTEIEKAKEIAERIRRMVEKHRFSISFDHVHATISIGIASYPTPEINTSIELINACDNSLYHAKKSGKNTVSVR
jgi:diguanylate cyclase (GGDEF)-like protein